MFSVKDIFLFDGLTDEQKTTAIELLPDEQSFKKGDIIYCPESFKKAMGVLLCGSAAAVSGNMLKRSFCEGDVFGAAALFGGNDTYISEIVADSKAVVQFIPEDVMGGLFEKYPIITRNYIAFLSDRVRFLNEKINHLSRPDADSKLLSFLVTAANKSGYVYVDNMSQLSKMLGIGRTSLYRSLGELEGKGLIEREENIIRVK